jgi:hypothetical protein
MPDRKNKANKPFKTNPGVFIFLSDFYIAAFSENCLPAFQVNKFMSQDKVIMLQVFKTLVQGKTNTCLQRSVANCCQKITCSTLFKSDEK